MKLKSYNYLVVLLMIVFCSSLSSEEKIDIWKNKANKKMDTQKIENEKKIEKIPTYNLLKL